MTKYSTAIPATLILSLFSSVVHGQNYDERNGKLLKTSNDFQCFSDGLHLDPHDCSVFYRCMDWGESSENSIQSRFTAMKFRCAEGTVFDIETSSCVNIEETSRLECRQLADDDTISNIFERQAGDPDYGVVQPQSGYDRPPQPPSYNRPGPGETDEQNPGDSGDGSENNNEPSSPSKSPPCEADGFFPIPNDCTHFYRCVSSGNGFLKYDFSCGPGTVWDPDTNACNHPWATSRPDCRSGTDGNQGTGPETIEISESPETAAQVAEPSSTTTAAPSTTKPTTQPTTRPTTRPSQPSTSSSTKPSTTKPSTTTTKRSTAVSSSTTTTTEVPSNTSPPTQGSKDNTTTGENSCTSEGFFPDGKNCTKFYRCVDEGNGKFTKYEFECAEGTVWDVQETTCNYPFAVQNDNCNSTGSEPQTATTAGQSSTSSSSQTSSRPTSTTSSSYNRPTSQSPSSSRPTSSTSSSYNRPTSQSTSSSNQQSSSSQTTSSSSQTSSSSSQTTSSSSQTSSSSSSSQTTSSQSSSSTSSTSSQSTSSNQQTSSQQSSSSTNSSSNQNNTTTSNAGTTTSSNGTNQTSKGDQCTEEGFFPSSENCNKFYRCVSNEVGGFTKYNFNCGPGTVWDPENNVCNHPWAVKDEKCRSGGQGTTPMSESTTESSATSTSESSTTALSSTTPSSNKTTTGKPKPTSNKPTTSSTSTTPSSNKTTTGKPATESSTQPSTSFTTTESSSKPTETPDENNSTTTTDSTEPSTTPSNNSTATTTEAASKNNTKPGNGIKCEKAGYYPNPKDCKKFYRCVDWDGDKGERFSVYHFDCPEGTIFDPALNICNHEESVYPPRDCSGSGSQTTDSPSTSKPDNTTTTESPTITDSSNSTDSTTDNTSEPTTIQPTTDASTNATEPITTEPSATTPPTTTPSESTTKKPETTTAVTSITSTPALTTQPEQTSTQPTTTEISTTPSSSETCPELGPDQYALVCPTGFRRHPKFCNLFYQCTVSKSMDTKIVILSCVNGTLYDEKKIQCLPPDETKKCEGSMAADSRTLKKEDNSVAPIVVKSDKPICPNEGLFSYKDDCRLFYKCKKDEQGKLAGFLYQCPEGFAFWSVSKRCEKTEKVPCENSKTSPTSWKSSLAPVESRNIGF